MTTHQEFGRVSTAAHRVEECFDRGKGERHAGRTVYTNSQNAIVVGWWIGALLVACIQRDRFTLFAGLVIGIGFGIGFPLSAVWCLGYTHAPDRVDWWKMWELHAGFHLGLLYVVVLYWAIRQIDKIATQFRSKLLPPIENGVRHLLWQLLRSCSSM
jgi:hypothetical protein